MTQREKLLATAVGLMVALLFSFYLLNWVSNAFASRDDELLNLQSDVQRQRRVIRFGNEADRKLQQYQQRSLPAERPIAQSLYQDWLVDHVDQAELSSVIINPQQPKMHGDLYTQHSWTINGNGELTQLIRFLHEFYSVDYLHRIGRLAVQPIGDEKQLKIVITIEAISLSKAAHKELPVRAANRLAFKEVEPYIETIAHRNIFAPANKPPEFTPPGGQSGNPNKPFTARLSGKDPDGDKLSYSLGDDALDGARIDPSSGQFSWTPSETGEFEFDVCVTDNGLPPKSVTKTFKVSVVQPPPPQPEFDPATMAKVTGITDRDGLRKVWINIQTEGRQLKLKEGDRIDVGTARGVIKEIRLDPREFEFATDDGRVVTVRIGKTLASGGGGAISAGL